MNRKVYRQVLCGFVFINEYNLHLRKCFHNCLGKLCKYCAIFWSMESCCMTILWGIVLSTDQDIHCKPNVLIAFMDCCSNSNRCKIFDSLNIYAGRWFDVKNRRWKNAKSGWFTSDNQFKILPKTFTLNVYVVLTSNASLTIHNPAASRHKFFSWHYLMCNHVV